MMRVLKNIMVTQMLLLRFQMYAVVNRVAVLHLRHRHGKSRRPRVVTITDGANLPATTSRIRWRHHDRRSIRIETRHRQNPLLFSTFGFATDTANPECRVSSQSQTSQVFRRQLNAFTHPPRRCRRDRRSTRNETRHRQSATRATERIRRSETASFKYPSIRCYRSSSQYQVTPHRLSCPCLVSFSVGHYDVLVSTPDSMFSVV